MVLPGRARLPPGDPERDAEFLRTKKNLDAIGPNGVIVSHFEIDGCYLHQRYPELLTRPDVTLFTFLRDPLELRLSLFYHEHRGTATFSAEEVEAGLAGRDNYLAERFPCDESNYEDVLGRYHFIGLQDRLQESLDLVARMLGKPRVVLPRLNARHCAKNAVSAECVAAFKARNALDYKIYDWARERLLRRLAAALPEWTEKDAAD